LGTKRRHQEEHAVTARPARTIAMLALLVAAMTSAGAVAGQEGHPLTGTWSGEWEPTPADRTHVTLVMSWDGKTVSGTLNPGPNAVPLDTVAVDVATWTVRIEAGGKDASGPRTPIVIEGRLENLGSYHRTLRGTWQEGGSKGRLSLTRD
jgi:hypothetical protein